LKDGSHQCGDLQKVYKQDWCRVSILGGSPDEGYINLWRHYDREGYEMISRCPSLWRKSEEPILDLRDDAEEKYLVATWFISQSGKKVLGAVHEDINSARAWASLNMVEVVMYEPLRSDDDLTREIERLLLRKKDPRS